MIFGICEVRGNKIVTSKTTYVITSETKPDVRRILLLPSLVVIVGLSMFAIGFSDLLYVHEITFIVTMLAVAAFVGTQFARLVVLDRVTRGTEQMSAIYGTHTELQFVRRDIDAVLDELTDSPTHHLLEARS